VSAAPPALIVFGAGRMGRLLVELAAGSATSVLALVSRHRPSWYEGGAWRPDLPETPPGDCVVIDFSLPGGTRAAADWCGTHGLPLVSGTTGLEAADRASLEAAASRVPVLWSANFSQGITAAIRLAKTAAGMLGSLAEVDILDVHHLEKRDAPSGTALALGAATGHEYIDYESRREAGVVGEHRVRFKLPGESLEITHRASERAVFARGALVAAAWLVRQPPGLYGSGDWLAAGAGEA